MIKSKIANQIVDKLEKYLPDNYLNDTDSQLNLRTISC